MDRSVIRGAPYFDRAALAADLVQCLKEAGAAQSARPAVLERLKVLLKDARAQAAAQLAADGNGRRCAQGLSYFQDELIRLVYDYTVANVYHATNPSSAERMASK